MTTTSEEMQKLLRDAPKWKHGEIPNLDHDTAYDDQCDENIFHFVKYDWPKILRYLRTLEKEHRAMREAWPTKWYESYQPDGTLWRAIPDYEVTRMDNVLKSITLLP